MTSQGRSENSDQSGHFTLWAGPDYMSRAGPGSRAGACFSKVPKLFGRISGDIILFVSSKLRRLEARNFAVIFIFIPFTTYEKTSFTELVGRSFTNGFLGPKRFRDFRETGPWPLAANFIFCYPKFNSTMLCKQPTGCLLPVLSVNTYSSRKCSSGWQVYNFFVCWIHSMPIYFLIYGKQK